jgi:hypothetical protein
MRLMQKIKNPWIKLSYIKGTIRWLSSVKTSQSSIKYMLNWSFYFPTKVSMIISSQ